MVPAFRVTRPFPSQLYLTLSPPQPQMVHRLVSSGMVSSRSPEGGGLQRPASQPCRQSRSLAS